MAFLGFTIDSTQAVQADANLRKMTQASQQAESAATRLGAATKGEAAGLAAVANQARVAEAALEAQSRAARQAMFTSRNLSFQLIDIAQTIPLAFQSPLYALQNVGFQVAQIGQEFAGQGGFMAAIRMSIGMIGRFALAFAPVGIAVGAVAATFAGLTYEINKTAETQVSMSDVFMATLQLTAEAIGSVLGPAISQIGTWFKQLWDFLFPVVKDISNLIIGGMVGAYEATKQAWSNLPNFFSGLGKVAWNKFIAEFEKPAVTWGDTVIVPGLDLSALKAPLTDAELNAFGTATVTFNESLQRDFVGDALGAVGGRAQELALAKNEVEALGSAAGAANDNAKSLGDTLAEAARAAQQEWAFYRNTFSGFFSDLKSGLQDGQSLWQAFGSAASNALDSIANRLLSMASNGLFDMLFGGLFGALTGTSIGGGTFGMFGVGGGTPLGFGGTAGIYPGFANGTPSAPGGWSWVGERGPELMRLPRGTQVVPHQQSMRMAANQNQANDNGVVMYNTIYANSEQEGRAAARGFTAEMRRWEKSGEGHAFVRRVMNNPGRAN